MNAPNKHRSDRILEFLSTHPLISRNAFCTMAGYDVSNLHHAMEGERSIPAKHLDAMEEILAEYGFKK